MDEEERALRAKGYVDITHIETQYGISRSFVHHRLDRIEVEKDYSPMGLPPREGDATVKGKDLYWQNPQSNLILIHPTLVSGWHQDIQQEQHLASKGFKRLKEAQELTGIERTTLINRLKTLNPDEDYTPAGLSPTTGSAIVKGKELVWKSAYTDKVTLIHPELIAGWKTAVDQEKKLLAKGYKKSSEIEEITGLSIAQISKRALALDPKEMIEGELITWTDPYSNKRLFHPSIVLRWQSSIEKGAEISKVGNIPVLNDELKRRLEDTNQGKDVGS